MMFRGRFKHNIDEKGRISLPSKFREILKGKYGSEALIITNYIDCLVAYPLEEWKKIEEKLIKLPWDNPKVRKYLRFILGSAEECHPDKQGRLLLPQTLRQEFNLEKEVILLGMLTHFEIWNPKHFEKDYQEIKAEFDSILQVVNSYLNEERGSLSQAGFS
jgi:MraZ protein